MDSETWTILFVLSFFHALGGGAAGISIGIEHALSGSWCTAALLFAWAAAAWVLLVLVLNAERRARC